MNTDLANAGLLNLRTGTSAFRIPEAREGALLDAITAAQRLQATTESGAVPIASMTMDEVFYFCFMFLPFVTPVTAVVAFGLVVDSVVLRVRGRREGVGVLWAKLVVFGACVAITTYGVGLFTGGLIYLADPQDLCVIAGPGYSYSPAPSSLLPLSNPKCWYEGERVDLVPAFVNPVFFASVGLFIVGVVGGIASLRSRSRAVRPRQLRTDLPAG